MQATDDVDVFYHSEEGSGAELVAVMKEYTDIIQNTRKNVSVDAKERKAGRVSLILCCSPKPAFE